MEGQRTEEASCLTIVMRTPKTAALRGSIATCQNIANAAGHAEHAGIMDADSLMNWP